MNLLYEAMAGGVTTFVYCSSLAAVGNFDEKAPIGEDYPLRPGSTYGCSKAAMDYVLRGLWKKVPLDICSLRLTAVYGPGRETEFNVDTIVRAALARKPAGSIRSPTGRTSMSMTRPTPRSRRASPPRASSSPITSCIPSG